MTNSLVPVNGAPVAPPPNFTTADVDRAHTLDGALKEMVQYTRILAYKQMELLWEIYSAQYYIILGYDSFYAYAASPELNINKSRAYLLVSVWDFFVNELGYQPEDLSRIPDVDKMGIILPLAKKAHELAPQNEHAQIEDLLATAATLSRGDLRRYKKEYLGGAVDDNHHSDIVNVLKECVGATLIDVERRVEADSSIRIALYFQQPDNTTRRYVLFANGADVDGRSSVVKKGAQV